MGLNLEASRRREEEREGEVKKKKALQLSKVCFGKNLELSAQSPDRSMPTHEHKQTHTDITMPNKAAHPLAHWLSGFKMDPFVSSSEVFVYLSVVSDAFDVEKGCV